MSATAVATKPETTVLPAELLKLSDSCDASAGAQAHPESMYPDRLIPSETAAVRLRTAKGNLLDLCSHHFNEHEAALIAGGATVVEDTREKI